MEYIPAKPADLSKWLEIADDVGEIMRIPNMGSDKNFIEYAKRKLEQNNAIMAYDKDSGKIAGFVGFSRTNNSVTWLGTKIEYQNQGIGTKLLSLALNELDKNERITVNTYPEHYLPGQPARRLYFKHGFVETSGVVFLYDGVEMVEMAIIPE